MIPPPPRSGSSVPDAEQTVGRQAHGDGRISSGWKAHRFAKDPSSRNPPRLKFGYAVKVPHHQLPKHHPTLHRRFFFFKTPKSPAKVFSLVSMAEGVKRKDASTAGPLHNKKRKVQIQRPLEECENRELLVRVH